MPTFDQFILDNQQLLTGLTIEDAVGIIEQDAKDNGNPTPLVLLCVDEIKKAVGERHRVVQELVAAVQHIHPSRFSLLCTALSKRTLKYAFVSELPHRLIALPLLSTSAIFRMHLLHRYDTQGGLAVPSTIALRAMLSPTLAECASDMCMCRNDIRTVGGLAQHHFWSW